MSPFLAAIFLHGLCLANAINFTTVYEWNQFDIIKVDSLIGQQNFIPNNVYLQYMAVFGKRLFLSLDPYPGIPATLVWLPTSSTSAEPPKLAPFPSWDLHDAKGLETDPDGRLWVVDQGSKNCSSKIWIFNFLNNDTIEHVHQFPDTVVSHPFDNRFLRDMVLDKTTDDYLAYIADSESEHITVYSRKNHKSWSVKTPGRKWESMALSANRKARKLYLVGVNSKELYSVSVSELKKEGGSTAVKLIGEWNEKPYRLLIDSANVLYAAFYDQNYTSKWNISEPFRKQRFHETGRLNAGKPFTFALDANGTLWLTERNATEGVKRHKLLKAAFGARSYLFRSSTALTTIPVFVNGVVTSTQTSTSKTGTSQPALESNETSGGFPDLGEGQSLNTILIWLLACLFVSCLVLCGTVIAWLTLRMKRMQTSLRHISMDNRAVVSVFPNDQVPANSNSAAPEEAGPENPDEPLYAEVYPEPLTSAHSDYASARTPSPEPYEVPLHLMGNATAGKSSEPVYDQVVGSTEPDHIYDDVGPGPSPAPSTESVQYLEVLP